MADIEDSDGQRKKKATATPQPQVAERLTCITEVVSELGAMVASGKTVTPADVIRVKTEASRRWGLSHAPKSIEILGAVPETLRAALAPALKAKPVRTASGIVAVAVMCKPSRCPHTVTSGRSCTYCAGGPDSDFEYSTQSYTGYEPTSMRAIRGRYDPNAQVRARIEQLRRLGHAVDKVEIIVMGGTFMNMDKAYRDGFVSALHDALSGHSSSSTVEEAVAYSVCLSLPLLPPG